MGEYIYFDSGAKVTDGIVIGSLSTALSRYCLDLNNITAIVNLSGARYNVPEHINVLNITMDDAIVNNNNINDYIKSFLSGVDFINNMRADGKNVLIHCAAGVNRSATLIGFYLISSGCSFDVAYSMLLNANNARRVQLLTNDSFVNLLKLFANDNQQ